MSSTCYQQIRIGLCALFISFLAYAPSSALAEKSAAHRAAFVICDSYCGIVDVNGKLLSQRVYESAQIIDGLVLYKRDNNYGVADLAGRTLIEPSIGYLSLTEHDGVITREIPPTDTNDPKGIYTTKFFNRQGQLVSQRVMSRTDTGGGASHWLGNTYYTRCVETPRRSCKFEFIDPMGGTVLQLTYFNPPAENTSPTFAVACTENERCGFVDEYLKFVIPPVYKFTQNFKGELAQVTTAQGIGIINTKGKWVVPAGLYDSVFFYENELLITAFRPGEHNNAELLYKNGRRFVLPTGFSSWRLGGAEKNGYFIVRGVNKKLGTVGLHGRVRIQAKYVSLGELSPDYLAFSDSAESGALHGLVSASGKEMVAPRFHYIANFKPDYSSKVFADDLFIVGVSARNGLIDAKGNWRIPAEYRELNVLTPKIIATMVAREYGFQEKSGKGDFPLFAPDGSRYSIEPIELAHLLYDAIPTNVDIKKQAPLILVNTETGYGLLNEKAQWVLPPEFSNIISRADGLLSVSRFDKKLNIHLAGLYQRDGKQILPHLFTELAEPFVEGAMLAKDSTGHQALIRKDGQVLASFNSLFPELANHSPDPLEQTLDICYIADPTLEPDQQALGSVDQQRICNNPALRKLSRETEIIYQESLAGNCLPPLFMELRPIYERSLEACNNEDCMSKKMQLFQERLKLTKQNCSEFSADSQTKPWPAVPKALQKQLHGSANKALDGLQETDTLELSFQWLLPNNLNYVLVWGNGVNRNTPFIIFKNVGSTKSPYWVSLFSDVSNSVQSLSTTSETGEASHWLRVSQNNGPASLVSFYQYDGKTYQPKLSCEDTITEDGAEYIAHCDEVPAASEDPPAESTKSTDVP
jgi:hypothetical protein